MEEKKEFNVDEGLKKLEEINRKLAAKETSLEEALELYKEGTLLAAKCKEHLEGVEKELQILNE
ncbi:MAG: exodeoxyribonuclease VII small subunit [Lachnospiraceae bacterium]|nr:exodeoxyribonuclease VII small subunit [Lachnospiraceae bacterium]